MEGFFLDGEAERLLCVYRPAAAPSESQRGVILIPPFAEELNMSRHTFGRLARKLAGSGAGVLTIDLYATGDSEGDFEDGSWPTWRGDVLAGIDWLNAHGYDTVDLLGLRQRAAKGTVLKREQRCRKKVPIGSQIYGNYRAFGGAPKDSRRD